ncbi:hypothetical protein [Actinomycetospora flava]|uniref:Uncharacterized protein n=1 Tax=Actinomycetospora flava TaxID=3129232 RepID=A0ABU8M530_9PSEU
MDAAWASGAHRVEIEAEALEVLRRLQEAAAPGRLVHGPASDAARVLARLGRDPRAIIRAAGLT